MICDVGLVRKEIPYRLERVKALNMKTTVWHTAHPDDFTRLVVRVQPARELSHPAFVGDPPKRPWAPVVVETAHLQEVGEEVHARLDRRETQIVVPGM